MIYEHEKQFKQLAENTVDGISQYFPVVGSKHTLVAENIRVDDNKPEDFADHLKARLTKKDWAVPIKGDLKLVDSQTGRVLDKKSGATLANLPKMTSRLSYIVGGNEYQVANIWRRRPGVYAHIKDNGQMESEFHLKGKRFNIHFDPETKIFKLGYGGSNPELYPILKALGVSDAQMKKAWGEEIFKVNSAVDETSVINKAHKAITGKKAGSFQEGVDSVQETFTKYELDPEIAEITLGKPHTKLNGGVLMEASDKLLKMSRGDVEPDPRDAIMFKGLHGLEDDIKDHLTANKSRLTRKITNNLDRKSTVSEIFAPSIFSDPIRTNFTKSDSANTVSQVNPLEMISSAAKATVMGPGAISSPEAITQSTRAVDPSHMAFIDPIETPEGNKVGVISHLPVLTDKRDKRVYTTLYNLKTGKIESVDAATFYNSTVILPDQVEMTPEGKIKLTKKVVKAAGPKNELVKVSAAKADYAMLGNQNMFGISTNMVPFLQNTDGARANMAVRHMVQAVGLKDADTPLVMAEARELPGGEKVPWDRLPAWIVNTRSLVDGKVTKVTKDAVYVKPDKGKTQKFPLYDNFPLNYDGAFLESRPQVSVGDQVKKGQLLADTNFSKGDNLSLGKNLRVAFMPIPGKTFEDSILVSNTAAKKLTSEHLYRKEMGKDAETITTKSKYIAQYPTAFKVSQLDKIDDDGVVKEGEIVEPGDPIVLAIRKAPPSADASQMRRIHKSLVRPFDNKALSSEFNVPAKVVRVHQDAKNTTVFLRTAEPAQPGDKLSGRHGNKGTIGAVVPDEEMPKDKDGNPIEVVLNPYGIPSRMNPGQIYELAASKVAQKSGQPVIVKNFAHDDYNELVSDILKKAGISEKEDLYDAKTGAHLGAVTTGPMHIIKQKHMVEHKQSVRGGGPTAPYDIDRRPKRGGSEGAGSIAHLDSYALIAHGAKGFLREAHTLRGDKEQAMELWNAVQAGQPLPPPKVPYVYNKFEGYLQGLGVNLEKKGNNFRLTPATDKDILALSNGPVKEATMVRSKDLKEEKGGLFDPDVTGGMDGTHWSHINLPEPFPNPVMEGALISVAGITGKQLNDVMAGKKSVADDGTLLEGDSGIVGGAGIKKILSTVDVNKEIESLETKIPNLSVQLRDKASRRLRYLKALKQAGVNPQQAYMMTKVPVIPPTFRPVSVLPSGDLNPSDINELYKSTIMTADALKKSKGRLPDKEVHPIRVHAYKELKHVMGIGEPKKRLQGGHLRGILHSLHGDSLKTGFVQGKMIKTRVDLSGRAVINPDDGLDLDEVGLPEKLAQGIYKPFVVRRLVSMGYTPLQAQDLIKESSMLAKSALENEMKDRPVFMKRDPVLHKYGVMAFKPKLIKGSAIHIHPLVTSPYNADFDGDAMAVYTPITGEAVKDAWSMLPSKHLFSPASGRVAFTPTNESLLGLYKTTKMGKDTGKSFSSERDVLKSLHVGDIRTTDVIKYDGKKTTAGRMLLYKYLPDNLKDDKILTDPTFKMDKHLVSAVLSNVGQTKPGQYSGVARKLLDLGNHEVYRNAHTLSLEDFRAEKAARAKGLAYFNEAMKKLSGKDQDQLRKVMSEAEDIMRKEVNKKHAASPSNLHIMHEAGLKPSWTQYKQLTLAPGLLEDRPGHIFKYPVDKSYGEGLDSTGFWIKSFGARKGMVDKGIEVSEPGALTKRMVNTTMDTLVTNSDCGTKNGEPLPITHPDIVDRYAAESVPAIGLRRNQVVTPDVVSKAKESGISLLKVRSPHQCEEGHGICAKCYGLSEQGKDLSTGTNIGTIASQSIGERGTQLTMRTFHTGGAAQGGMVNALDRVQKLLYLPQNVQNSATLSKSDGKITDVKPDPAGGSNIFVAGERHYVPASLGAAPGIKKGKKVFKGQPLSNGVINPHKLLPIVGLDKTRRAITDELDSIYSDEGIRRRNIEVVARALTNLGEVEDPGSDPGLVVGDVVRLSKTLADNKNLKKPVRARPILKGVESIPHDQTEDWLARLNHTRIKDTIRDAVAKGFVSKLHSQNPIPSLMHGAEFGLGDGIEY